MYKINVYTSKSQRGMVDYISSRAKYQNVLKNYSYAYFKEYILGIYVNQIRYSSFSDHTFTYKKKFISFFN